MASYRLHLTTADNGKHRYTIRCLTKNKEIMSFLSDDTAWLAPGVGTYMYVDGEEVGKYESFGMLDGYTRISVRESFI